MQRSHTFKKTRKYNGIINICIIKWTLLQHTATVKQTKVHLVLDLHILLNANRYVHHLKAIDLQASLTICHLNNSNKTVNTKFQYKNK